jgi:hypothetical protein
MTHQATATQTPAPNAPTPTAAPPAVTTSVPEAISASLDGMVFRMPTTQAELRAMRNMRDELSDQLQSAARRRENLAEDLDGTTASLRPGLQARIDLLDKRILQIEQDIATTGALVARSRGQLPSTGRPDRGPFNEDRGFNPTAVGGLFTLFVLAPIAIAMARRIWRRGGRSPADSQIERENADRLGRLEQSVDTIAVEVERISEGQRFVTKLLNDSAIREKSLLERGSA